VLSVHGGVVIEGAAGFYPFLFVPSGGSVGTRHSNLPQLDMG
jgi:hypothetical protein